MNWYKTAVIKYFKENEQITKSIKDVMPLEMRQYLRAVLNSPKVKRLAHRVNLEPTDIYEKINNSELEFNHYAHCLFPRGHYDIIDKDKIIFYCNVQWILYPNQINTVGFSEGDRKHIKEYVDVFYSILFHEIIHFIRDILGVHGKVDYWKKPQSPTTRFDIFEDDEQSQEAWEAYWDAIEEDELIWNNALYISNWDEVQSFIGTYKYLVDVLGYSSEEAKEVINKSSRGNIDPIIFSRLLDMISAPTRMEYQKEMGQQQLFANTINWHKIAKRIPNGRLWVDSSGKIYDMGTLTHHEWIEKNIDYLKSDYGIDIILDAIKLTPDLNDREDEKFRTPINDQLLENGWLRVDLHKATLEIGVDDINKISTLRKIEDFIVDLTYEQSYHNCYVIMDEIHTGNYVDFTIKEFMESGSSFSDFVIFKTRR